MEVKMRELLIRAESEAQDDDNEWLRTIDSSKIHRYHFFTWKEKPERFKIKYICFC